MNTLESIAKDLYKHYKKSAEKIGFYIPSWDHVGEPYQKIWIEVARKAGEIYHN